MKELTLLEKFAAGWEIRHSACGKALQIIPSKVKEGGFVIEWERGYPATYSDIGFVGITCTPPRERRWVNVWYGDIEFYDLQQDAIKQAREHNRYQFIATLCIERVDGKWVLVDEKGGDK